MENLLPYFSHLLESHPLLAPFIFIAVRIIPIVIPPFPGIVLDFVGIAFFGPGKGLILALIAGHIAASFAFYVGRYFREGAVRRFASIKTIHELEEQYSEKKKFLTLVTVRFFTAPLFFDYMSYAAGLTKMSFTSYIFSTFIGVFPYAFLVYYFGGISFSYSPLLSGLFFLLFFVLSFVLGKSVLQKIQKKE